MTAPVFLALFCAAAGSSSPLMPVGSGNALTLPAQRHLVRLESGTASTYLLAVQQQGGAGRGLGFWRSNDDGDSWSYYAPIQDNPAHADTADLLASGMDVALTYSIETPASALTGSTQHDVYFQWWRYAAGEWSPQLAVRVFDSTRPSTGLPTSFPELRRA